MESRIIDKIDELVISMFGGEVIMQGEISKENEEEFFGEHLDEEQKEHQRIFEDIRFNQELHNQRANIVTISKRMEAQMNDLEQKQTELQAKLQKSEDILFDVIGTEEEEAKEEIKAKAEIEPEPPPQQALAVEAPPTPTAATANVTNQIATISKSINDNIAQFSDKINIEDIPLLGKNEVNVAAYGGDVKKDVEEPQMILDFFAESGINFLIGKGGLGKTFLAYNLVVSLLKLGYEIFYVDLDNPPATPKRRRFDDRIIELNMRHRIRYYNFVDAIKVISDKKVKNSEDYIKMLMNNIASYKQAYPHKKIVVFLDALQNLISDFGVEKSSSDFMRRMRYYSGIGLTYIILHHTIKSNDANDQPVFRGYGVLRDSADTMYFIKEVHHDDTNAITDYVLKAEKNRWDTTSTVTIKLKGSYECDIVKNGILGFENMVLKLCYINLKDSKKLKNELIEIVQKGLTFDVGKAKISDTLDELVRRKYLLAERGDRKSMYFSINKQNNDLVRILDF